MSEDKNKTHAEILNDLLPQWIETLSAEHKPLWGQMSAQHVLEHIHLVFGISDKINNLPVEPDESKRAYRKMKLFGKDSVPFKENTRAPVLPKEPMPLQCASMEEAKTQLYKKIEGFHRFFKENPEAEPAHPAFGPLNYSTWIHFHAKHCTHHFRQMGVIDWEI